MYANIKEICSTYNLTQKELSEITEIPLKIIDSWGNRIKQTGSMDLQTALGLFRKVSKDQKRYCYTNNKHIHYRSDQRDVTSPCIQIPIYQASLIGEYASGTSNPDSHIRILIQYSDRTKPSSNTVEEINQSFMKVVDIFDKRDVKKHADIYIMK